MGSHPLMVPEQPFSGQVTRIGVSVENNISLSKYQDDDDDFVVIMYNNPSRR